MSKSTKIIAALGVVAGLGVAALPAFTYAAESVTGDVQVDVEVLPAIAMTITGNNDDSSNYDDGTTSYASVDNFAPATTSGTLDGHTIPATAVLGTSSSYTSLLPNAVIEGDTFKSTITVYTNASAGYTLTMKDSDTTVALTHTNGSDTIPATAATTLTAGTAAWGYRVGTSGDWLAVPASDAASDASIKATSAKTSGGDATTVEYGVATAADQATGVYTDTIVYTATTN